MSDKNNRQSQENRIRFLYQKYIERTSSDSELTEMFDLLKDKDEWASVREVLHSNWERGNVEELATLDWETFKSRIPADTLASASRKRKSYRLAWISVAASVFLAVGIASWFWMHREIITVYETGYGEIEEIVLNDESTVRLNANSTLYWDSNWKRRGSRKAQIEGEAFFNVAHQDGGRFFVSTPDLTVMVTGTSFNVSNRHEKTKVFLETGEVYLTLNRENLKEETGGSDKGKDLEEVKLIPGEQLSYSRASEEVERVDNLTAEQAASWKTGELIFENIPLREVLQELSDVYGKSFVVQDSSLFERKIDVGMPYSDWETVKELMQFMIDVKIAESNNKVTIK